MFSIVVVFVVCFTQVDSGYSLQCVSCQSSVSWQDCDQRKTITNCSSIFDQCLTHHKITPLTNGQQKHEYQKACHPSCISFKDLKCNQQIKDVTQPRCTTNCCNETQCNAAVTPKENEIKPFLPTIVEVNHRVLKTTRPTVTKPSFYCYKCRSSSSWEDCIKKQTLVKCRIWPYVLDACTSYHRVLTLKSGHQEHSFVKTCWMLSDCSSEACRETSQQVKGSWCDMRCCTSSACNRQEFQKPLMLSQKMSSTSTIKPHGLLVLSVLVLVVSGLY